MKIEPFENINCENQNLNINNNTKISDMKTSSIKNLLLQILTPDTLSTLSNFILPMLNKKENNNIITTRRWNNKRRINRIIFCMDTKIQI